MTIKIVHCNELQAQVTWTCIEKRSSGVSQLTKHFVGSFKFHRQVPYQNAIQTGAFKHKFEILMSFVLALDIHKRT